MMRVRSLSHKERRPPLATFARAQAGVLEVLLAMGNHLNQPGGAVDGFRLDSRLDGLLDLKQTRGRGTLLRCAVRFIRNSRDEAGNADILGFPKGLAGVKAAAEVCTPARDAIQQRCLA